MRHSVTSGIVKEAEMLSPTVRRLRFQVRNSDFVFKPGQWVDCVIPQTEVIGGFSLVSSPLELPFMDLAIKESQHSPSRVAVHETKIGDDWKFRVGGSFTLPGKISENHTFLFLAAGIGITALRSMIRHLQLQKGLQNNKCALLHCAKTREEIVFREDFDALAASEKNFMFRGKQGRFIAEEIVSAIGFLGDPAKVHAFLCGPPGFAETMANFAIEEGHIPQKQIQFEKWW